MWYSCELSLNTSICIEKWISLDHACESIIWWGYSNQHVLFVKTTPNKCGHIIHWLEGDEGSLLLLKQHEKSGWSIIVTVQKYHTHSALMPGLLFPRRWGIRLGKQRGVWAKQLSGLQGTASRNMTHLSPLRQVMLRSECHNGTAEGWLEVLSLNFHRGGLGKRLLPRNITSFVIYTLSLSNSAKGKYYASTKQSVSDFLLNFLMHWNLSVYGDVHVGFFSLNTESTEAKNRSP